eukprot:CAMPEP_0182800332 /NCGR_PEP_ID=MMETSP0006_2-20121128/2349_1 /TAXON_ID=97485 /ORGANISM="Prymnesium parvum, Strain Texoma1" /LENGTH=81 /DNA_ID=CAMNT_0024925553 /DNA_START=281 /DNA_END=526 /DNA_ORIENTATION=-
MAKQTGTRCARDALAKLAPGPPIVRLAPFQTLCRPQLAPPEYTSAWNTRVYRYRIAPGYLQEDFHYYHEEQQGRVHPQASA